MKNVCVPLLNSISGTEIILLEVVSADTTPEMEEEGVVAEPLLRSPALTIINTATSIITATYTPRRTLPFVLRRAFFWVSAELCFVFT